MRKYLLSAVILYLAVIPKTYSQSSALDLFKLHSTFLLKDGGKWISENSSYDSSDENSPLWFGYEYSKGFGPNTLNLKVSEYLPQKAAWVVTRECNYLWNHKKNKAIVQSVGTRGDLGNGETEKINPNEWIIQTTVYNPDGTSQKLRGIQKIANEKFVTTGFVFNNGKWKENGTITWKKMNQPKGNISFMSLRDGNFEIYSMALNGENLKNISCNKATDFAFSHLPNNDILYYSNRTGNNDIYLSTADGKKTTNLTNHPASDRIPNVSPDGKKILFVSDRDHKEGEVYMMNIDGSNVVRFTNNEDFEDAPQWSPDGKRLVYTREVNNLKDTSKKTVSNGEIFISDIDGSNEQRITSRPGWDGGATFSPDGKQVAFYGKSDNRFYDIFVMDADANNLYNLTNDAMEDYSPAWSPDGKWIAFTRGNSKNYDVWIIELETKIKSNITNHPRRDESPIWQY